jgi:hypothetical protein
LVGQSAQHHHIPRAHIVIAIGGLTQPSQLLGTDLWGQAVAGHAQNIHLARGGQQAGQGFEQGGFSRTIRARDAGPTPARKRHIQGVQHSAPTQGHLQASGL